MSREGCFNKIQIFRGDIVPRRYLLEAARGQYVGIPSGFSDFFCHYQERWVVLLVFPILCHCCCFLISLARFDPFGLAGFAGFFSLELWFEASVLMSVITMTVAIVSVVCSWGYRSGYHYGCQSWRLTGRSICRRLGVMGGTYPIHHPRRRPRFCVIGWWAGSWSGYRVHSLGVFASAVQFLPP